MKQQRLTRKAQRGFTIIELMIATSVLSVILLLVTTMMISIGNLFYKGVNQARIQDAVRSTADEISQQLELSGSVPKLGTDSIGGVTVNMYCIGSTRYSYVLNTQMGSSLPHILWRDNPTSGCDPGTGPGTGVAANLTVANPNNGGDATNGAELASPNSRLTAFCIGSLDATGAICTYNLTSPYTISVGMAYGDNTLLANLPGINAVCNGSVGDQFCATAHLTTTVANRL
ncbi:MAG TPA: prepilin-type N-terminal cleavage/methylation domain-containing protein [Candidatus Saccharimonadales bacterium]